MGGRSRAETRGKCTTSSPGCGNQDGGFNRPSNRAGHCSGSSHDRSNPAVQDRSAHYRAECRIDTFANQAGGFKVLNSVRQVLTPWNSSEEVWISVVKSSELPMS